MPDWPGVCALLIVALMIYLWLHSDLARPRRRPPHTPEQHSDELGNGGSLTDRRSEER